MRSLRALAIVSLLLTGCTVGPRPQLPQPPPAPATASLFVHVCDGTPCEQGNEPHKAPGAVVWIDDQGAAADDAGNRIASDLTLGDHRVCAVRPGFVNACADVTVPDVHDVFLLLVPDVPPVLPIHVDGKYFRDATGALWPWRGVTAFSLLKRFVEGHDIGPYLEARRAAGANLLRVLTTMQNIAVFPPTAYTDAQLQDFLRVVHAHGLRVELVALADAQTWPLEQQQRHVQRVVDAAAAVGAIDLVEVANEAFKNSADPRVVMREVVRQPGVLMAAGGDSATCDNLAPFVLDYITLHNERKDEWPRTAKDETELRDGFGCGEGRPGYAGAHVPVVSDEPMGADETDQPGKRATSPDDFFWFAATAQLLGAGATFHSSAGILAADPGSVTAAAERAFFAGLTSVPIEAQTGLYTRGLLTTCPLEHDDAKALRTFCMLRGGVSQCVVIRPTPAWTAAARDGWRISATAGPRGSVLTLTR